MRTEFEVYQCGDDHPAAGMWSFKVNGNESLYYSPNEHGIRRVLSRLDAGRGRELRQHNRVAIHEVAPVSTAEAGTAAARPHFTYALDGSKCVDCWSTEAEARREAAIAAFMTRGKLGRLAEISKAVGDEVEVLNGTICCKTKDVQFLVKTLPDTRGTDGRAVVDVVVKKQDAQGVAVLSKPMRLRGRNQGAEVL